MEFQGYHLGSVAPNGIVTIAMQQQGSSVSVNQGTSQCDIDLRRIKPNLTQLFEVTCE
jgi:outer membrane usher protein FimD/PapC